MYISHPVCPFISWWTLGLPGFFCYCEWWCCEHGVQMSESLLLLLLGLYMELLDHMIIPFNFLKSCFSLIIYTVFYRNYTILHYFCQQHTKVLIRPHFCQYLFCCRFFCFVCLFLIIAIQISVRQYLIVVSFFSFPWWSLMSSIFLCAYWPHLWKISINP